LKAAEPAELQLVMWKRTLVVTVSLLLVAAIQAAALKTKLAEQTQAVGTAHTRPEFCNGLDCPDYEVRERLGNDIQLRRYDPSTWAVTHVDMKLYETATTTGFQRLFKYIEGDNELEEKIPMTAPVVTTIRLDDDDNFKDDFTVSFFLPFKYQRDCRHEEAPDAGRCRKRMDDVPIPRDDRVHVVDFRGFDTYVLSFDGYAFGFRVRRLALDLFNALDRKEARDYVRSIVFVAVYDAPFKVLDRHNELWVLRKRKGDASDPEDDQGDDPSRVDQPKPTSTATY